MFEQLLTAFGLPAPVKEHQFCATRKWRFDYAWPAYKVALEVEGGVWAQGRHTRGNGFVGDMEKYNAAASEGWRLLRVTLPIHTKKWMDKRMNNTQITCASQIDYLTIFINDIPHIIIPKGRIGLQAWKESDKKYVFEIEVHTVIDSVLVVYKNEYHYENRSIWEEILKLIYKNK